MKVVDLTEIYGDRPYPARPERLITDYIVHHAEGTLPQSLEHARQVIAGVDRFHRETRGWPGIAYHRAAWDEFYFVLRPAGRYGWHSAGADRNGNGIGDGNDYGLAVVMLGSYTQRPPSERTLLTVAEGWAYEEQRLGRRLRLSGHQDWWATSCPGVWWPTGRLQITHLHDQVQAADEEGEVPIPAEYQTKFGIGPGDTVGLIANFEGIIQMLLAQSDELQRRCGDEGAAAKLDEIRKIVNR